MTDTDETVLEATSVQYGSTHDEDAFFEWLAKIPAVRSFRGRLHTVYIRVDRVIDDESLSEVVALFDRYDVDLAQLAVFDTETTGDWFRNPDGFWHARVFGGTDTGQGQPS